MLSDTRKAYNVKNHINSSLATHIENKYNHRLLKRFVIKDSFIVLAEIKAGLFTVFSDLIPFHSFYKNYTDALKDFYSFKKEIKKLARGNNE